MQDWFEGTTLHLSYLGPNKIYEYFRQPSVQTKWYACFGFLNLLAGASLTLPLAPGTDWDDFRAAWLDWSDAPAQMVFLLVSWLLLYIPFRLTAKWLFKPTTLRDAVRRAWRPFLASLASYAVLTLLWMIIIVARVWMKNEGRVDEVSRAALMVIFVPLAACALAQIAIGSCLLLVVVVRVIEIALLAILKVLWRVVEWPQGAWSAILFLITAILTLIKVFVSGHG